MKFTNLKTLAVATILALVLIQTFSNDANCAPNGNGLSNNINNNNNNNNNNRNQQQPNRPINFLRGLFRRQTSSSATSGTSTNSGRQQSNVEAESEDGMTQPELEAQKFMNSLPNFNNDDRDRPNTFRERISGTFGVLRDGVSNQFKTMRENWSETIEDLRDTWSNSEK